MREVNNYCHTAKEVADFLGLCNTEGENWWNYVTALRGSDICGNDFYLANNLKILFTCIIRGKGDSDWNLAWNISYTLDLLDDNATSEIHSFINALFDIKFEHYKHHLALGFRALAFYYKYGCDEGSQKDEEVYATCASKLLSISYQLDRDYPFSVFKYIHEFLMLVSDEINEGE